MKRTILILLLLFSVTLHGQREYNSIMDRQGSVQDIEVLVEFNDPIKIHFGNLKAIKFIPIGQVERSSYKGVEYQMLLTRQELTENYFKFFLFSDGVLLLHNVETGEEIILFNRVEKIII